MSPGNFYKGHLRLVELTTASFTVVAGANGWVDTDVSATTGLDTTKVFVFIMKSTVRQSIGVRAHGASVNNHVIHEAGTYLSNIDSSGHVDLMRDPGANNIYSIVGYLK